MRARIRKFFSDLGDAFWLTPALMVLNGIALAAALIELDRGEAVPSWLLDNGWIYSGGATGARTLLGAVASSTIGVAGTVFTITIAALSLAANQMGPRLLRNFTRDRGNQVTLGVFLGTFSYALMVLRSVRTPDEGGFVPHLALSVGVLLALASVATLVYFVGHMAGRINVDVVIELVTDDVRDAMHRLTFEHAQPKAPPASYWQNTDTIVDIRHGYLQHLDADSLADWAAENDTAVRLLVRPGNHVFPGAPLALMKPAREGAAQALSSATALGQQGATSVDLEYAVRQLVEVGIRALSPGINDPHTAINVLDRLASTLCELSSRHLPTGIYLRHNRVVLQVPSVDYDGLTDTMFHMLRQNGAGKPAVLIRMLEVITAVARCEQDHARRETLRRHADLIVTDAQRSIAAPADLDDVQRRYVTFLEAVSSRQQPVAEVA